MNSKVMNECSNILTFVPALVSSVSSTLKTQLHIYDWLIKTEQGMHPCHTFTVIATSSIIMTNNMPSCVSTTLDEMQR